MEKAKSEQLTLGLDQIPYNSLKAIGRIFKEGEKKYGKDNWKQGVNDSEYQTERWNHACNHLMLYKEGDTSEEHLAKVAWYCIIQMHLLELEDKDDKLDFKPTYQYWDWRYNSWNTITEEEELAHYAVTREWIDVDWVPEENEAYECFVKGVWRWGKNYGSDMCASVPKRPLQNIETKL